MIEYRRRKPDWEERRVTFNTTAAGLLLGVSGSPICLSD